MKLEEGKLILNDDELTLVKRANCLVAPDMAAMFLKNAVSKSSLEEDVDNHDIRFYTECIKAYRQKNYEIR